ncbi:carbohydrate kinase [Rhizobium rhizogenes]|uniref:FGGY-family carbohydrate kinase n=1 Tax=Rhizobium rhizogenes TaxID=359 RepID=UPI00157349F7|nr:carbohydrate kinase [Rhizobium rhizogenes]NTI26455.1 carbohydrate kinase [Rhizobium rhizogenes]NTI65837.1 carbohydrate kinase [Rhizobium rhizogenes]QTG08757.1 carbohydrate kinase [Rhizobium rhizogenes]
MALLELHHRADGHGGATLAVFDFGKTNAKMLVFAQDGSVVGTSRTAPRWYEDGSYRLLDDAHLWDWMQASLKEAAEKLGTDRIMIATHGCTFALIADDQLVLPILDYEFSVPDDVRAAFCDVAPDFSETGSPDLPNGLNYGLQVFWRSIADRRNFASATAILPYPQFWTWRLTGVPLSEVSYLGCHSHLWSPFKRDFSSLVDRCGWREKMPRLERAGVPVGTFALQLDDGTSASMTVHNGVHDSNAALSFYVALGYTSFSLISTGTWVIVFNTDAPLSILDKDRDMLANVTIDQSPVVTARFMGGREYELISKSARVPITITDIENAIRKGQMALPSFAAGGPFPGQTGCLLGPPPADERARAAIATLYLACMTSVTLELVESQNTIIIDGGLANNPVYPQLVAALRRDQTVLLNVNAEGTSTGAASLAFETFMESPFTDPCIVCKPAAVGGLHAYFAEWKVRTDR